MRKGSFPCHYDIYICTKKICAYLYYNQEDFMKKFWQSASIAILMIAVLIFSACGVKVTFDIGDATLVSGELTQKYKEDTPIVPPSLEKNGYVFVGWDKDFSAPTEEITVTPIWKKLHTVTFDIGEDGATENKSLLTQEIVDGESATAPEVSRDGYAFDGWDKDFSVVNEDLTVSAKWKKIHTVTFELLGGTTDDTELLTQKIVDGEAPSLPKATKEKYNFIEWDADVSSVTSDMTVKAVWERKSFTASEIFKLINPGTVEIKTYRLNQVYFGMGSGFFINEDGLLLTNYHVIDNARAYQATMSDGTVYDITKVIAYDKDKDIAILQADTKGKKVPYLEIGTELPKVGDAVYAIGSSLGLTGTFSSGIVSYVNRTIDDIPDVNFIQTTTPISSGNSGGPLVDEKGYVIGINSASYTEGQNLNLAVEISQYLDLKECNLTPEKLFVKEGTLKYFFGEVLVKEASISAGGQVLENGSTVQSTITGETDDDYYLVKTPDREGFLLLMYSCDDKKDLEDLQDHYTLFYSKIAQRNGAVIIPYYFYGSDITDDNNGKEYLIVVAVIDKNLVERSKYIGVQNSADKKVEYEMFMYAVTAEEFEAIS